MVRRGGESPPPPPPHLTLMYPHGRTITLPASSDAPAGTPMLDTPPDALTGDRGLSTAIPDAENHRVHAPSTVCDDVQYYRRQMTRIGDFQLS
ncbi:hypothetical protein E2C01_091399 [Portunus trituberculatus]|uniref:Uncharacterized protein n=1 Tax=Portunus trituberculatus TaxID=210409 RepID=A0A5B7JSS8_PORTR|nr:hypothetical protein [Portunus trituberculatus]